MDALMVSIATGLTLAPVTARQVFRLGFHFGLFQFLMPITGWLLGRETAWLIEEFDYWVAFGLLCFIGGKMLLESFTEAKPTVRGDPTRGWSLIWLSIATSIDALAVGLSLAYLGISVWVPASVIGLITAVLTTIGILFAGWLGQRWSSGAGVVGGCVLIAIGFRILLSHLNG
jgi:putative Mn2+ efflux pump MntP